MDTNTKIEKILETGVTKEALWNELVQWMPDNELDEFLDDFITLYDIDNIRE